jgi:kynurenine formamidase
LYDLGRAGTTYTPAEAEAAVPIVAQGFLLDVAHFKGQEGLGEDYAISAGDLEGAMRAQGRLMMPGGVILVRTGAATRANDPAAYAHSASLSAEAQHWIRERHPHAVGIDGPRWSAGAESTGEAAGPGIFTNLNLEGLAAELIDHVLLIASPILREGAADLPVRPIAIELQVQSDMLQP